VEDKFEAMKCLSVMEGLVMSKKTFVKSGLNFEAVEFYFYTEYLNFYWVFLP